MSMHVEDKDLESEAKKRTVSAHSNRRVKVRSSDGGCSVRMDEVEAALPETLDLTGRADLSTEGMNALIAAAPHTSILKLDGCLGLGDDMIDCVCKVLGAHITELSLKGCTQLKSEALMSRFHDNFPCLHTLDMHGCTQLLRKDMAMMVVARTLKGLLSDPA